jgi:LPXTG-site transpeptidase (sortase) family protein
MDSRGMNEQHNEFELNPISDFDSSDNKNFWHYSKDVIDEVDTIRSYPIANIILPIILMLSGFYFIFEQFKPDIQQKLKEQTGQLAQGTINLAPEEYISMSEYISFPNGLEELTQKALSENVLKQDTVSLSYSGVFYLSIPALGMNRLPVDANVDSSSKDSYLPALEDSLAHFKYTGLPISDVPNNIVIYGHSASPSYNPKRTDPMVAFSYLQELSVGDDIFIEIDGKTFQFKMQKSKIVNPTDVEIITGTPGKRTLTLFTCFPNGSNSKRYVAIAREV